MNRIATMRLRSLPTGRGDRGKTAEIPPAGAPQVESRPPRTARTPSEGEARGGRDRDGRIKRKMVAMDTADIPTGRKAGQSSAFELGNIGLRPAHRLSS